MDVESGGPARDDPVALARARRELERLRDPQGRVAWLADNVQRERQSWEFLAPRIGLSPEELEQFLVAKAEGELQWTKRSMECQVDLACNWGEQPEGRRDSDAELLRLLGKDRHARYRKYIGAMTERSYVREMQRRLPPDDPLADAQAEQFALALAEERERLIAEALRQGETVSGPAYFNTLQLYGVAKEGSPDEFTKRRESAAEYAGRLFGRASALLSRSQLADFKQMLDRNLAVYDESMREREVMAAARISNSGTPTTTNQKKPETLALARYRLERLREPGNYKAEAARLTAQIRYDWYQRAVVAEVSSRIYDQLVDALGVAELQHQELLLECDADPVCDRYALRASHNAALDEQAASIAGADKFAIMQVYKEAYDERSFVDDLRSQLPPDHALTDPAAWKLALALATERQRFVRSAERDGLELHVFTPLLATSRPGTTDGNAQRLATAAGYARRLHDVAASNLDGEQIRQFDALHQQSLARLKAALQESEWLQSVREAAASQGQNHEAVERR